MLRFDIIHSFRSLLRLAFGFLRSRFDVVVIVIFLRTAALLRGWFLRWRCLRLIVAVVLESVSYEQLRQVVIVAYLGLLLWSFDEHALRRLGRVVPVHLDILKAN